MNGAKTWITNGSIADVAVVWAKLDGVDPRLPRREGDEGLHDVRAQGQDVAARLGHLAARLRGLPTSRPTRSCPGVEGLKGPLSCLTQARYGIAWGALGSGDGDATRRRSSTRRRRKQWMDRPIAAHQLVQERLAWMITEITKAQLLALEARPR